MNFRKKYNFKIPHKAQIGCVDIVACAYVLNIDTDFVLNIDTDLKR